MPDHDNDVLIRNHEDFSSDGLPIFSNDLTYEQRRLSRVICDVVCDESVEVIFSKNRFEFPGGFQNISSLRMIESYLQMTLLKVENEILTKIIVCDGFVKVKDSHFHQVVRFYFIDDNYTSSHKKFIQSVFEKAIELIANKKCEKIDDLFSDTFNDEVNTNLMSVSDDFLRNNSGKKITNGLTVHTNKKLKISTNSTFRRKQFKLVVSKYPINAVISDMHKKSSKTNFVACDANNNSFKINFLLDDFFDELLVTFGQQIFVDFCLKKQSLGGSSKPSFSLCQINPGECEDCQLLNDANLNAP